MRHTICCIIFIFLSLMFSSQTSAISIPEEKKVADKFMKMVKDRKMVLNDPVAAHMVEQVGRHILTFLPPQPFDYSFFVVDDDIFNAFASPGANIFFYRGLITSLDSIDELAGIMAHEIAHAASRHVSESIDRSKYINLGSLAGILAGAIIGTQGSGNGDTGAAIMKGSMAIGHTAMLAFTRENETEADEKGILFLKKSCFSTQGLMAGLMKIRESDFRGVEDIPDYVKTHPGTGNRIAHVETILSGYTPPPGKEKCKEIYRFDMVKNRLLGLYADVESTYALLSHRLKDAPEDPALNYGIGLIYDRKFMRDKALSHLKKALSVNIFDPMILLEMGRIYIDNQEPEKALGTLKGLSSDPIMGMMADFHTARAHLELGNLKAAKKLFSQLIEKAPNVYPKAYYFQANILAQEKQSGLSHYNLGIFYSETGNPKTAKVHLRRALKNLDTPDDIKKAKELLKKLEKQFPDKSTPGAKSYT